MSSRACSHRGADAAREHPTPLAHVDWHWRRFGELSTVELYDVLRLRALVFVVEQQCAFADPDGYDPAGFHLLGCAASLEEHDLLAYARVLPPETKYAEPSIGRVVTAPGARGRGLGRAVMHEALRRTRAAFPGSPIRIGAQARLQRFYENLDFVIASAPYDEDGIPHVEMVLDASGGAA